MNCNQAFEQLTDPELRHSRLLQRHLQGCPRCRQMQETMAPALAQFSTERGVSPEMPVLMADDAASGTFASSAFLSCEALEVAEQAAERLSARANPRRAGWQRLAIAAGRYAAVFMIGGFAAYGTFARDVRNPVSSCKSPDSPIVAACTRANFRNEDFTAPPLSPRNIVLSCVACHLENPPAAQNL